MVNVDDYTLDAVMPPPFDRVGVEESLNCDFERVCEWCDLCE